MRLQNYYISDREYNPVARDESEKIFLVGVVYGRSDIPDGSAIRTSTIASLNDKEAVTEKGEVYELDGMSPDYIEFLDAKKRGIDILNEWDVSLNKDVMIETPSLSDPDALKKVTDPDNLHTAYMFTGKSPSDSHVYGEVVGQSGNYVTLKVAKLSKEKHDFVMEEKVYFVIWRSLSLEAQFSLGATGEVAGLEYKQWFEEAFHLKCRPKMF